MSSSSRARAVVIAAAGSVLLAVGGACGGGVSLGTAGADIGGDGGGSSGGGSGTGTLDGGTDCTAPGACGPAPAAPAQQCPDGSVGGNTGRCLPQGSGCGWEIRTCPPAPACFDATGNLSAAYKTCKAPADCVVITYVDDCCGTTHVAGVNKTSQAAAEQCAAQRAKGFGTCGCPATMTKADDGTTSVAGQTPSAFCNTSGLCESTFESAACATAVLPACPTECATFPMTGSCASATDTCRMQGSKLGDECTCKAGSWSCTTHGPLGAGCNLTCR